MNLTPENCITLNYLQFDMREMKKVKSGHIKHIYSK